MAATDISNPILNSPYGPPEAHFELGPNGQSGVVLTGRRPSESFIPIPTGQKRGGEQQTLNFDATGERREQNSLINDIRREVERRRASNWNGVTPYSRKLLAHWAAGPPTRDEPVFFCQREPAENGDLPRRGRRPPRQRRLPASARARERRGRGLTTAPTWSGTAARLRLAA
jgi:type III restriction enzyme